MQHELDLFHLFLNQTSGKEVFNGADAVIMGAINGAKCLGLEKDFGSIETGKVADLVIAQFLKMAFGVTVSVVFRAAAHFDFHELVQFQRPYRKEEKSCNKVASTRSAKSRARLSGAFGRGMYGDPNQK